MASGFIDVNVEKEIERAFSLLDNKFMTSAARGAIKKHRADFVLALFDIAKKDHGLRVSTSRFSKRLEFNPSPKVTRALGEVDDAIGVARPEFNYVNFKHSKSQRRSKSTGRYVRNQMVMTSVEVGGKFKSLDSTFLGRGNGKGNPLAFKRIKGTMSPRTNKEKLKGQDYRLFSVMTDNQDKLIEGTSSYQNKVFTEFNKRLLRAWFKALDIKIRMKLT